MQPTQWCLCANALAAIAAWQVAQWTMTLRRVQGGKLVKQVELLHAGARSGAGWNWSNKKWILQSDTINKSLDVIKNTCATSCYRTICLFSKMFPFTPCDKAWRPPHRGATHGTPRWPRNRWTIFQQPPSRWSRRCRPRRRLQQQHRSRTLRGGGRAARACRGRRGGTGWATSRAAAAVAESTAAAAASSEDEAGRGQYMVWYHLCALYMGMACAEYQAISFLGVPQQL